MRRFYVVSAVLLFVTQVSLLIQSHPALAITIQDVPSFIQTKNEEVQAAQKDVEISHQRVWVARTRYFPSLEIKNVFFHLGQDIQLQLPTQTISRDLAGGNLGFELSVTLPPVKIQDQNIFTSQLVLKQPLYAGGRISAALDAAHAQEEEANLKQDLVKSDKITEALIRYFKVQLARESILTLQRIKDNLERLQGISEALVKSGLGSKFSALQIQVALADLNAKLSDAKGKTQLADIAFKVITGMDELSSVQYDTPLRKSRSPAQVDLFKIRALQKRKEFSILRSKGVQTEALKAVSTGEMLPTAYAFGTYNIWSYNLPTLQPVWAVGLGVDIPISNVLKALPERREAILLREKVEILEAHASHQIPLQIEKIYSELQAVEGSLGSIEQGLSVAKEALRLAEIGYKSGNSSSAEVLRASSDLESMEIRVLLLTEEFNRKLIELYAASGDISLYLDAYGKT